MCLSATLYYRGSGHLLVTLLLYWECFLQICQNIGNGLNYILSPIYLKLCSHSSIKIPGGFEIVFVTQRQTDDGLADA